MAVEFGRIEEIKNAPLTYDEDMEPKVVYPDNNESNVTKNEDRNLQKNYKCTYKNCDFAQNNTNRWKGLIRHMAMHTRVRNIHLKENGPKIDSNCPHCKRIFGTPHKLLRHVEGKRCRENNSNNSDKEKF